MKKYRVYKFEVPRGKFEIVEEQLFSFKTPGMEIVSEGDGVRFKAYFEKKINLPEKIFIFSGILKTQKCEFAETPEKIGEREWMAFLCRK